MTDDLDDILAGIDLGHLDNNSGTKAAAGNKKANKADAKDKDHDKVRVKSPVPTTYEGFTLRPITPAVGEKKTWAKCDKKSLPFDDAKLYEMAALYRQKSGRGPASHYRELSANQQGIIDRILAIKRIEELDDNAVWELHSIRPITKEVQKNWLRSEVGVYQLELIVCRKDKNKSVLVDKPTGTTVNPQRALGEIIDLDAPLPVKPKKAAATKKAASKAAGMSEDALADIFDAMDGGKKKNGNNNKQNKAKVEHQPDDRFFWNGEFWEEREPPHIHPQNTYPQQHQAPYPHQQQQYAWDPRWQQDHYPAQQQYQQHQQQQYPAVPPLAPMPDQNPFQPIGTHPAQYADMPANMDPRQQHRPTNHHASRSRSRSRSRHRARPSRRHSRHRYTPSMSSSEADYYSDFTPPSTPPNEEFISAGSLHRHRHQQKYYREKRTPYRDERYELRPAVSYKHEYDYDHRQVAHRPRPILVHDDYPRRPRRLTDFPEGYEEIDVLPRRHRDDVHYVVPRHAL